MKLINEFSKEYGMEDRGGIIKFTGTLPYEFEHMHMFKYEGNQMLEEYKKAQESGEYHELSSDEIKILCERIDALLSEKADTTAD